jgi:hypothetical protein
MLLFYATSCSVPLYGFYLNPRALYPISVFIITTLNAGGIDLQISPGREQQERVLHPLYLLYAQSEINGKQVRSAIIINMTWKG